MWSTTFKCAFKVDKNYIARVQSALKQEERGEANTLLRATPYFRSLDSFITNLISRGYDFEEPLRKRTTINITANGLIQVSFDYPSVAAGDDEAEAGEPDAQAMATRWDPEVAFYSSRR